MKIYENDFAYMDFSLLLTILFDKIYFNTEFLLIILFLSKTKLLTSIIITIQYISLQLINLDKIVRILSI